MINLNFLFTPVAYLLLMNVKKGQQVYSREIYVFGIRVFYKTVLL